MTIITIVKKECSYDYKIPDKSELFLFMIRSFKNKNLKGDRLVSRKESVIMYICIFISSFGGIFLFHLLSWLKPQLFFSNHYEYFSSGRYSFVWMIGFIVLLLIGTLSWFQRKQVSYVCAIILLLFSFAYITSYKGVTNRGFESHFLLGFQENVNWEQIKQIDTDYRVDETKGVFYPTFTVKYANDQTEQFDDWENIVTSKPNFTDMTSSGWVNDDEDLNFLGLQEVKLMEYVYQHVPSNLHCVQRGFLTSKPKKQVEAWDLFAKHFVGKSSCLFESEQ